MLKESKKVREHIIEITEPKLRRVGGGREEKMLEKCGGQYWGRPATLQSRSWEVSQSISVGVFISLFHCKTALRPHTAPS